MRKTVTIVIAILLIVVIVAGALVGWSFYSNSNKSQNKTSSTVSIPQIRDRAMAYIAANYTGTVQVMQSLAWTGGRVNTGLLGSEKYLYTSGNWYVQIQNPVVANPIYAINVTCAIENVTVNWTGQYNGAITETSHQVNVVSDPLSTPQEIRDIALVYLQAYHNETAQYMNNLSWGGGRTTPSGLVGAETYTYQTAGTDYWHITIHYPVVLNPIYSVNATYTSSGKTTVSWQGTLQSGVIIETAYKYSP